MATLVNPFTLVPTRVQYGRAYVLHRAKSIYAYRIRSHFGVKFLHATRGYVIARRECPFSVTDVHWNSMLQFIANIESNNREANHCVDIVVAHGFATNRFSPEMWNELSEARKTSVRDILEMESREWPLHWNRKYRGPAKMVP